jgi:hypothetical protein
MKKGGVISKNNFLRRAKQLLLISSSILLLVVVITQTSSTALAASFDQNNLISDNEFIDVNSMNTTEIQNFLESQGSFLKSYSENGRSAAQIINDAAHGYNEASGTFNGIVINTSTGTVSPKVILTMLQKEQSLISMTNQNDDSLRVAMSYGCPDSGGCSSTYAGFTKQVENGAWQLRYNYERAQGLGFSDYQVGQTQTFVDFNGSHSVTFGNRATSSLYRYAPHVYNGNYNFWNLYTNTYQFQRPEYGYTVISQNSYPTLMPGNAYNFVLTVKNTGRTTWTRNIVKLGTNNPRDRVSGFYRESGDGSPYPSGWLEKNRILMQESSVAPDQTATFSFWMQAPRGMSPGVYKEGFNVVADGITWLPDLGVYWNVTIPTIDQQYSYSYVTQSAYPSQNKGEASQMSLTIKNTGTATWTQNSFHLGTDRSMDRVPLFLREPQNDSQDSGWVSPNRIRMQESSVAPGQTATFVFWEKSTGDMSTGNYREYFRPVQEGVTWLSDGGIYWDVKVNDAQVT